MCKKVVLALNCINKALNYIYKTLLSYSNMLETVKGLTIIL